MLSFIIPVGSDQSIVCRDADSSLVSFFGGYSFVVLCVMVWFTPDRMSLALYLHGVRRSSAGDAFYFFLEVMK